MAKIQLTKKNFTDYLKDKIGNHDIIDMISKIIGKPNIGLPDTELVMIDTDKILMVSQRIEIKELKETVFYIVFDTTVPEYSRMWFDAKDFFELLRVWANKTV